MPVVTLQCLTPDQPRAIDEALSRIVHAVSQALGSDPSGTWAHWSPMAAVYQGLHRVSYRGHCPVITVRGRCRDKESVAAALSAVAGAASGALAIPVKDVWVQWLNIEDGQAFAGGQVVNETP